LGYISGPCSEWGGLLSLSGIKEINYKQIYKNDPYMYNSNDGLKMETSTTETNNMAGYLAQKRAKSTFI